MYKKQKAFSKTAFILLVLILSAGLAYYALNKVSSVKLNLPLNKDQINTKLELTIPSKEYSSIQDYNLEESTICSAEAYEEKIGYPLEEIEFKKELIDNISFDKIIYSEGAAGSIYTTNDFLFKKNDKCYVFESIIRNGNCGMYPDVSKCETVQKQENKELDTFINHILISLYKEL